MNLHEIHLTATESNWRLFMIRKADSAFLSFQEKVFNRDQYSCQFCGFQSQKMLEVINLDGNYLNNRLNNLVSACSFCAQCFFLEAIGKSDFGGGILIYLPEMSQNEINAFCHVLFASLITGNSYSSEAKNIYRSLKLRSQPVEQILGSGFSNPALLGQAFIDAKVKNTQEWSHKLSREIRLLPNLPRFIKEMKTWANEGLGFMNEALLSRG